MDASRFTRLTLVRLAAAALVLGWAAMRPEALGVPVASLAVVAVGYAAVATCAELARRRIGNDLRGLFTGLLCIDGVFLAATTYATGATLGPTGALVYLHVVAVTLLFGSRIGVAAASWHAVLMLAVLGGQAVSMIPAVDVHPGAASLVDRFPVHQVTAFIGFVAITTLLAALDEREGRRRSQESEARAGLAMALGQLDASPDRAPGAGLVEELRSAVDLEQLRLAYQPIVNLGSGRIAGLEALVRWQHPRRGEVQPGDFLGAAEANGAIGPVGRWVLRRACEQVMAWQSAGLVRPDLFVSVNVSAREVEAPGFVGAVEEALAWSRLVPARLVVEVPVKALSPMSDATLETFVTLRTMGVRVALDVAGDDSNQPDDLAGIALDALKFTMSETDGRTRSSEALVRLGRASTVATVAQHIETAEQAWRMRAIGCSYGQGFYFAAPLAVTEIDDGVEGLATDHRWQPDEPSAPIPTVVHRGRLRPTNEPFGQPSTA
ncbi:MAG: EAL domain-containing protein [Chloroflexi bacterium]|nr:EAL domain-containing protein [Chloroflexota bacterium]